MHRLKTGVYHDTLAENAIVSRGTVLNEKKDRKENFEMTTITDTDDSIQWEDVKIALGRSKRRERDKRLALARPFEAKLLEKMSSLVSVQRKLNGERCFAEWDQKKERYCLLSSTGIEFKFLEHIQEALLLFKPGVTLDGELYRHGWSRERIHSVCSRRVERSSDEGGLEFWIFDTPLSMPLIERINFLNQGIEMVEKSGGILKLVSHNIVPSQVEKITALTMSYMSQGFEGAIIRDLKAPYTPGRSSKMLKLKPTKTDRYRIVGYKEEIDKNGVPKDSLGAITVDDRKGSVFSVGTGSALTRDARERLWKKRETLLGKTAVVKYCPITTNTGLPTCTSLLEIE